MFISQPASVPSGTYSGIQIVVRLYCYKLLLLAINNPPLYSALLIVRHIHIWYGVVLFFGQAFEKGYVELLTHIHRWDWY